MPLLDELESMTKDAKHSLSRLHNLQLMIAEAQPVVPSDALQLLERSIEYTASRIPA